MLFTGKIPALSLSLVLFSGLSLAQQPMSVMNKEAQPLYSSSPRIESGEERSKHCTKLAKQVEELKGKPQRRYAAAQRYKQECGAAH